MFSADERERVRSELLAGAEADPQGIDLSPVGADCFQHRCLIGGEASIAVSGHGDAVAAWTVNPDPRRSDGSYVQAASYTAR
ncbi:MAG TPA: hypothetical protein VIU81_02820 [Gaiellaceae bacterium]